MPVSERSKLKTVSLVLRKDQVERLRMIATLRSSPNRTVGLSEVAKEIVEAGLQSVSHAPISSSTASREVAEAAA